MKRKYVLILSISLFIIAGIVFGYFYTFRKAGVSAASKKVDYTIEASLLLKDFENNEQSAYDKYLGKVLIVEGIFNSFNKDNISITVYLKHHDDISGVLCSFNKTMIDPEKLHIGDKIKVKGICTGYLMDVVLNKCSLVK